MSTELAEPPVDQPKATPAAQEPTPEARKAAAAAFLRPKVTIDGITSQAPEPLTRKEPAKEPDKSTPTEKTPPADPKENSLAELRKARDEARKQLEEYQKQFETEKQERARIATEYEEFKKNPVPKEFHEKLSKVEQEKEEIRQQLRAAALERDPQFKREFTERINANAKTMLEVMVQGGIDPKEARTAIETWDQNALSEHYASLPVHAQVKMQAAWSQAEQINQERINALQHADEEWQKREQLTAAQQKAHMEQQQQMLNRDKEDVLREMFATDWLKDDPELQKATRESVEASFSFDPKTLMKQVASARVLAETTRKQLDEIKKLKEDYAALEQKHKEQSDFIKGQNSGTPRLSPTDPAEKPEDKKARANSFLNPTVVYH